MFWGTPEFPSYFFSSAPFDAHSTPIRRPFDDTSTRTRPYFGDSSTLARREFGDSATHQSSSRPCMGVARKSSRKGRISTMLRAASSREASFRRVGVGLTSSGPAHRNWSPWRSFSSNSEPCPNSRSAGVPYFRQRDSDDLTVEGVSPRAKSATLTR